MALSALGAGEDAKLPAELAWLNGKVGILAQLGRLHFETWDTENTRRIATQLCEIKLKVKAAIAAVRRYQLGREAVERGDGLLVQLANCVDNYRSVRPSVPLADILMTIERLHALVANVRRLACPPKGVALVGARPAPAPGGCPARARRASGGYASHNPGWRGLPTPSNPNRGESFSRARRWWIACAGSRQAMNCPGIENFQLTVR
jgi:hypothetical protein